MTKEEFAQQIKTKYPQYSKLDNIELADKMLNKYPVYKSQIEEKSAFKKVGDFIGGIKEDIGERVKKVEEIVDRPQTLPSKAVQFAGQAAGLGLDILGRGASAITPDVIEEPIMEGIEKVVSKGLETKIGKKGLEAYQSFKKEHPEAAGNIEAAMNIGAITPVGKAGQVATKQIGKGIQKGIAKTAQTTAEVAAKVSKLKPMVKEKIGEVVYNKLNQVSKSILKMSPTAAKNEAKWRKNTPKFLVDEGIIPLIESDGKKLSTGNAINAVKAKYNAEAQAFNSILVDSGEYISLRQFEKNALSDISDLKTKGTDFKKAQKQISEEMESFKENFKDIGIIQGDDMLINVVDFNKIKSGLWSRTSSFSATQADKLASDMNYRMGHIARDMIENKIDDASIKSMSSRLGDFISSIKVLENVEGKVVPGGFFGKQFTRIAGTVAGVGGGGAIGAIIGNITGGVLADLMMNPKIKTSILTKINARLNKTEKGRNIIEEAAAVLKKRGEERASRKLLEAPSYIPLKGKTDVSKTFTQEEAKELYKAIGVEY